MTWLYEPSAYSTDTAASSLGSSSPSDTTQYSLWHDVTATRMAIKHAPKTVDLDEVRMLLGRVEDALEVLTSITYGADIDTRFLHDDDLWLVAIRAEVSDRGPLFRWLSDG